MDFAVPSALLLSPTCDSSVCTALVMMWRCPVILRRNPYGKSEAANKLGESGEEQGVHRDLWHK